jgi:hypothetical protein
MRRNQSLKNSTCQLFFLDKETEIAGFFLFAHKLVAGSGAPARQIVA